MYPQPVSSSGALALALAHRTPVLMSGTLARSADAPCELVAPRDPEGLASVLEHLARAREELRVLQEAGDRFAAGRAWPAVARQHMLVYEEALA
jgi:hypothetical protein